jgi:hypothetical protein
MYAMKWETIKKKAIEQLCSQIELGSGWPSDKLFMVLLPAVELRRKPRELLAEWTAEAVKIIERWDIRMVGKLIELFPNCINKQYKGLPMRCEIEDKEDGEWVVCFGA